MGVSDSWGMVDTLAMVVIPSADTGTCVANQFLLPSHSQSDFVLVRRRALAVWRVGFKQPLRI